MKLRSRILAVLMALLLAVGMPLTALAETYDLNEGSVTIDANETGQTVTQNEVSNQDSNPVITSGGDKTSNTITVNTNGGNANVTLDNVNINSDGAAMEVNRGEGTTVTVELDGTNTLQSGEDYAGLQTSGEGALVIQDANGKEGSLTANGGFLGAGIGGGIDRAGSDITISGGDVEANGGDYGAGIGGGFYGAGSDIIISGGKVTANGGDFGAGIGGGYWGKGSGITIKNNAVVTAEGKDNAANIGNGHSEEFTEKQPDNVDVSGLYITGSVNGVPGTIDPNAVPGAFDGFDETAFWKEVVRKIQAANPGDTVSIDAGGLFTIPCWVIDAVVEQGVTLVIAWMGGEDIIIDHQPDTGSQKIWVFSFTTLPQLLAK